MKNTLLKSIRHFFILIQANYRNSMQLKLSFWLDVFGMFINNIAFVIVWVFFFQKVGTVNNWGISEAIGLNGMVGLIYGITFAFAGGVTVLANQVNSGNFDNFLISPVSLYIRIITSYSRTAAYGDILYGIVLLTIFIITTHLPLLNIISLFLLIPIAASIMINFVLVSGLISFLIPDTAEVAANLFELLVNPSLYPSGLYSGTMKMFFLFVIPAIAIAGAPIELVRHPTLSLVLILIGISAFWTFLAFFLLKKAIVKYDSGNLVGYKVNS